MPFQDPSGAADPVELDINGNPIPAKNLFAAPAPADAAPPETTPPPAPSRPTPALRPLTGGARPGQGPRPAGAEPNDPLLGAASGYDLAGNPLPSNAPPPGGGLYSAPRPGAPAAGREAAPHGLDPTGGSGYGRRYKTTVNGGLILGLGIGGFIFWPLSPVAWVMGNNAVGAIKRGDANPAPLGQANAGRVCGMVGSAFIVLGLGVLAVLSVVMPNALKSFPSGAAPLPAPVTAPAHGQAPHHAKPHHAPHHE